MFTIIGIYFTHNFTGVYFSLLYDFAIDILIATGGSKIYSMYGAILYT
jgi:hypothetical protein